MTTTIAAGDIATLASSGSGAIASARRIAELGVTPKTIRAWAIGNGIDVPVVGVVPNRVIDAYINWHDGDTAAEAAEDDAIAEHQVNPVTDDLPDEPEVEAEADEEPATTRLVAISTSATPHPIAAVMNAAAALDGFASVAVEDGWIYLEASA